MGRYEERLDARAVVWPEIEPERFPLLQAMVDERLTELESASVEAAEKVRQSPPQSSGGLVWLFLAAIAPRVLSHLHQDLGYEKNKLVGSLIMGAWFLFLLFIVPAVVPSVLSFLSRRRILPEKELADRVRALIAHPTTSDQDACRDVGQLIRRQRSLAIVRAHHDLKWTTRAQNGHAMISLLLIIDLIVIGSAFVLSGPDGPSVK